MAEEITRYSDGELQEFKDLLANKIESARDELKEYQEQIRKTERLGDSDYKASTLDDGTDTVEKEYLNQMAGRQLKFISNLEKALVRIENKTYGICRETGKLISKERLKAVPHATLSIEAKNAQAK